VDIHIRKNNPKGSKDMGEIERNKKNYEDEGVHYLI
jgi:hypothetical protein